MQFQHWADGMDWGNLQEQCLLCTLISVTNWFERMNPSDKKCPMFSQHNTTDLLDQIHLVMFTLDNTPPFVLPLTPFLPFIPFALSRLYPRCPCLQVNLPKNGKYVFKKEFSSLTCGSNASNISSLLNLMQFQHWAKPYSISALSQTLFNFSIEPNPIQFQHLAEPYSISALSWTLFNLSIELNCAIDTWYTRMSKCLRPGRVVHRHLTDLTWLDQCPNAWLLLKCSITTHT